ncbi:MAG: nuclear transport factor 2 family protein [Legionella sp.]|nr:nuclear transport factor 2 family protein [Legionella sp.]
MSENHAKQEVEAAVRRYFELMYDCDMSKFNNVFRDTAQLHGFREGQLTMWPASQYRQILSERQSPKSIGATREEEILLIDFASDSQALAKVKVRINTAVFIDYLTFHKINGQWLITSKAYHLF